MTISSAPSDAPILDQGETILGTFRPDRGRYWRDHGIMAVVLMAVAGIVLWIIGSPYPAIGSLGAILAVGVRAAYLASETLKMRWVLTDRRIVLHSGERSVMLSELETVRTLLGDVQIITRAGDKYLLKHAANGADVVAEIDAARGKRATHRAS